MTWLRRRPARLAATPPADVPAVVVPAAPADPNARYVFQPGPAPIIAEGMVTLDELFHLSRSP